jgi:hypothetical protein
MLRKLTIAVAMTVALTVTSTGAALAASDHTDGHDFAMGLITSFFYNKLCAKLPGFDKLMASPVFMAGAHEKATDKEIREASDEVAESYASSPAMFCEAMKPIVSQLELK